MARRRALGGPASRPVAVASAGAPRMSELSVVSVVHDTRAAALRMLSSLGAEPAQRSWPVVIVDNESSDGLAEGVREVFPAARVIRNVPQRGFAAGLNSAIMSTETPFVAHVSPNTIVRPGTLSRILTLMRSDPRIAAAGPLILSPDGRPQRHGMYRPRPFTALVVLAGLADVGPFRREAVRYYGSHAPGPSVDVEQLTAACLVIRRAAFEAVGPFDERFFIYAEDADWCLRASAAGWRIVFVPDVSVLHEKAATSKLRSRRVIRAYYRSMRAFYEKHYGRSSPLPLRAFWLGGSYVKEAVALLANALRRRKGLRY